MDIIICSVCGGNMNRFETVNGVEMDWTNETPVCPKCRGNGDILPLERKRDVLGGFAWKRDAEGKKVPK